MIKKINKNETRVKRHVRLRHDLAGTTARPRLCVYRSLNHIYAQIIDDTKGITLVSASSMDKDFSGYGGNIEGAKAVGFTIKNNERARVRMRCLNKYICKRNARFLAYVFTVIFHNALNDTAVINSN